MTVVSLDSEAGAGVAERNRRLARHLTAQGDRCEIVTLGDGDLVEELRHDGVAVHTASSVRLVFPFPLMNPLRLAGAVRRADVVHLTGYWNLLTVVVAVLAVLLRRPYVLCPAGELAALEHPRPALRAFHLLLGRHVVRRAALLVAITELERDEARDRLGLPADRVVVVPNGVDPTEAVPSLLELPPGPFVLFMGRLAPIKGPDLLLRAFAEVAEDHPDVSLLVAGPDAGMGRELRALTDELGLGARVRFTGHLGEADRAKAYGAALLLAIPSRSEAMSLVALEAGIAGLPVLLTDRCGFDAVARVGGGVVVGASVSGLSSGLAEMLGARDLLPARGERLRRHVQDHHGWPRVVAGLVRHLDTITGRSA